MKENVRLIDANEVIKVVDKHTRKECSEVVLDNDISCILEEVSIAYDVDKVIEKLTENLNRAETELANLKGVDQQILLAEREYLIGKKLAYAEAIDIIRADVEKMNKKRTNYEKIVSMGIDELADWMFDINIDNCEQILFCKNYKKCTEDDYSPDDSMCKKCLMNWLQQEAITK